MLDEVAVAVDTDYKSVCAFGDDMALKMANHAWGSGRARRVPSMPVDGSWPRMDLSWYQVFNFGVERDVPLGGIERS